MKQFTMYLAGTISGSSYDEVMASIDRRRIPLSNFFNVLHPMTGKNYLRNETTFKAVGYDNPVSTNRTIVGRDMWMVSQSDIIFADLTGSKIVSIGTVCEMAWAHQTGKLVILAIEKENIHQHAFVLEMADTIFETVDEAMQYLMKLSSGAR